MTSTVIVFESAQHNIAFTMPGALRKARRQVLFVDCRLLQAYNPFDARGYAAFCLRNRDRCRV